MKEKELRDMSVCGICKKKIGASGVPMFFRVTIEQYVLDVRAVQRQNALGIMIGAPLAQVMGPDEDLAKKTHGVKIPVCFKCGTEKEFIPAVLIGDK